MAPGDGLFSLRLPRAAAARPIGGIIGTVSGIAAQPVGVMLVYSKSNSQCEPYHIRRVGALINKGGKCKAGDMFAPGILSNYGKSFRISLRQEGPMTQKQGRKPSSPSPLLPDELAMLSEIPAVEKIPEDIASALATRRLYINVGDEPERARSVDERKVREGNRSIDLPPGRLLGRAGQTGERLPTQRLDKLRSTGPMRPAWAAQSYQPRVASERFVHIPMQRLKGTQIEP